MSPNVSFLMSVQSTIGWLSDILVSIRKQTTANYLQIVICQEKEDKKRCQSSSFAFKMSYLCTMIFANRKQTRYKQYKR